TFDINTACAGFVTALDIARKFLAADAQYTHALVIGAYAMSRFLDLDDKKTATLFADGAGAVVLRAEAGDGPGLGPCKLHTDGQYHGWMGIYAGGAARPITPERLAAREHTVKFVHKFPVSVNPDTWTRLIGELCEAQGITPLDIDRYVFTQLNINSIHETLTRLGVPTERGHTVMQQLGYTGSACIPMAFDDAVRSGAVGPGDRVAFVASGGGLAFAAMLATL
ncbi:MAG: ketoacyl-ACP synthase III, partial [Myxococcales bacterium]|nr:ketoacyl-ACP synthase III [Myxococcales bacterium]